MTTAILNDEPIRATRDVCPICGGGDYEPLFQVPFPCHTSLKGNGFPLDIKLDVPAWRIVRCSECSVRYPNPLPTKEAIHRYYADQQEPNDWEMINYVEIPEKARQSWSGFAERLTRLNGKPGSILEIGCAAGWLLDGARKLGWDAHGIEASPKFQKYAESTLKLPVRLGTIESVDFGEKKFDVIVNTDVIEHLYDPVADLKRLRKLMKPGGYLVMATCDIGSPCAQFWGLNWRQIVISHTFYWTKQSMTVALERAGFRVERFSEPRYWHPVWRMEQARKLREIAKLIARFVLLKTYVPLAGRNLWMQKLVKTLSAGKLDHEGMLYRIGDQPVLGDVMLVVARPM